MEECRLSGLFISLATMTLFVVSDYLMVYLHLLGRMNFELA